MLTIREFNADAFTRAAQYTSRVVAFRRGTECRAVATGDAVAQSRVLIANADALLAINALRPGWLWPAASPAEEDRCCDELQANNGRYDEAMVHQLCEAVTGRLLSKRAPNRRP
jgi:hypothetical protein